jgi:hypothetical protein
MQAAGQFPDSPTAATMLDKVAAPANKANMLKHSAARLA